MNSPTQYWPSATTLRQVLLDRVALGVCTCISGVMALAYAGVLPDVALVVGVPALVATILLDTFLYNAFRFDSGVLVWVLIAGFVYLQSVLIGMFVHWLRARR